MKKNADTEQQEAKARRRRGAALEAALLEAAWDELMTVGYSALTMEKVAARAKTSKMVLYRRFATRAELVLAALRYHKSPKKVPDTGSLRSDVLALLRDVSARNAELAGIISVLQADYYAQTGLSPSALTENTPGAKVETMELLLRR